MNRVLILVFNILASSQAKPDAATNMVIEHAKISMPADNSGGGDYASQGNQDTNLRINKANIHMEDSTGGGGGDYASQGNQDTNVNIKKAQIQMETGVSESGGGANSAAQAARDYLLNRRNLLNRLEAPRPTWSVIKETNDYVNYGGTKDAVRLGR